MVAFIKDKWVEKVTCLIRQLFFPQVKKNKLCNKNSILAAVHAISVTVDLKIHFLLCFAIFSPEICQVLQYIFLLTCWIIIIISKLLNL